MKFSALIFFLLLSQLCFGQSLTVNFNGGEDLEMAVKKALVQLIKSDGALTQKYQEQMDKAFDFLDPEDPRRISASDMENLGDWSLSLWKPSMSFRFGQGNITCANDEEIASYEMGTMLAGFDTSYKREATYGFWSSVSYTYHLCEDDNGKVSKSLLHINHKKWIQQELVEDILGFYQN